MKKAAPKDDSSSSGDDFNAMLTTEGMLQVEDVRTGKTSDVRKMLGIKSADIKNEGLKEHLKNFSVATSQPIKEGDTIVEEIVDGAYFDGLNTLEFDMGTVGPDQGYDEEEKTPIVNKRINSTAWADWYAVKEKQNTKIQEAIKENSLKKVVALLEDPDVGNRPDVNHNITF